MTIYVTVPGTIAQPVIVPDSATVTDFAREVFELTGCTLFKDFGYTDNGSNTSPFPPESTLSNASLYDSTTGEWVSLADVSYGTAVDTVFSNGDTVIVFSNPLNQ